MIALCSKTYILKQTESKFKFSSKGANKRALTAPYAMFKQVLETREDLMLTNRGFRSRDNTIHTYEQTKRALSYFYCKRRVLDDGIHTKPLNIVLCSWPDKNYDTVDSNHTWSLTKPLVLCANQKQYTTLAEVCQDAMTQEEPKEFVRNVLSQLPPYKPRGVVLVAITKDMLSTDYKFWHNDTYWSTGMSVKASPLRQNTPGQNVLGQLLENYQN